MTCECNTCGKCQGYGWKVIEDRQVASNLYNSGLLTESSNLGTRVQRKWPWDKTYVKGCQQTKEHYAPVYGFRTPYDQALQKVICGNVCNGSGCGVREDYASTLQDNDNYQSQILFGGPGQCN
jgi:hypothetical protein